MTRSGIAADLFALSPLEIALIALTHEAVSDALVVDGPAAADWPCSEMAMPMLELAQDDPHLDADGRFEAAVTLAWIWDPEDETTSREAPATATVRLADGKVHLEQVLLVVDSTTR
jgi:hypothetical protein